MRRNPLKSQLANYLLSSKNLDTTFDTLPVNLDYQSFVNQYKSKLNKWIDWVDERKIETRESEVITAMNSKIVREIENDYLNKYGDDGFEDKVNNFNGNSSSNGNGSIHNGNRLNNEAVITDAQYNILRQRLFNDISQDLANKFPQLNSQFRFNNH